MHHLPANYRQVNRQVEDVRSFYAVGVVVPDGQVGKFARLQRAFLVFCKIRVGAAHGVRVHGLLDGQGLLRTDRFVGHRDAENAGRQR